VANWLGVDYSVIYSGLVNHKMLLGVELQRNKNLGQRNFDVSPRMVHLDDRRSGNGIGLFVQDEWRIGRKWMINFGVRADQISGFDAVSPRSALIYHPVPEASLKLIYGKAFRPPNSYEHYYNDGNVLQKANADLKPERNTTHELAADYVVSSGLRVSGSYYHYRLDDLIEQIVDTADGLQTFINRPPD